MVTTDDDLVAKRIRLMRLHGIDKDARSQDCSLPPSWYYEVIAPGFEYISPTSHPRLG